MSCRGWCMWRTFLAPSGVLSKIGGSPVVSAFSPPGTAVKMLRPTGYLPLTLSGSPDTALSS